MQAQAISIGTSGWKFDDWAGSFYPLRVPKNKWLEYYAARFPIGEINSTYYRIAPPSVYAALDRKTPANFEFTAKVHADVTHARRDPEGSLAQLLTALDPLRRAGKLLGLLAQFPASFRFGSETLKYVQGLVAHCAEVRLCVEFRHRTWDDPQTVEALRSAGITWVCPDEPDLPDLMPHRLAVTSDLLYVRLHGRNRGAWYGGGADRYDYEYSAEEMTGLGRELLAFDAPVKRAVVLFNNCYAGRAPRNAWWLKSWFEAAASG